MSSTNGNRSYKEALDNKTILVTGGTGSFGHQVVEKILEVANPIEKSRSIATSNSFVSFLLISSSFSNSDFCNWFSVICENTK